MPKNNVTKPITDQEIAFARLVLAGTMNDRRAAEAAGLNPNSAPYTKSKPRVRAYMLEHRAAVQQQLVEQDTGELRRFSVSRDQVLTRLWEIANMEPERTRNSMSSQVKALSMIVAIEGLIPDRHSDRGAVSAQDQPPPPVLPPFYVSAWARTQQQEESQPPPSPTQQEAVPEPQSTSGPADGPPPPTPDQTPMELSSSRPLVEGPERSVVEGPAVPRPLDAAQTTSSVPRVPAADYFAPDTRVPFSIPKNPFARRRR